MRGKGQHINAEPVFTRITPAYAGKRTRESSRTSSSGDHPRLCGEKTDAIKTDDLAVGSPPPMRGKAETAGRIQATSRITPAYAGKSFFVFMLRFRAGDHPRLCGEKSLLFRQHLSFRGSPPPMRGKEALDSDHPTRHRITPAYAGKSKHRIEVSWRL